MNTTESNKKYMEPTSKCLSKRLAAVLTGLLLTAIFSASSRGEDNNGYISYPHAYIGIQGGGQTTFTDYNNLKLITPTASVSVGVHFTPIIGARVHVNGRWNKSGISDEGIDVKYKYKYTAADIDAMINMVNLFAKGNYHPLNVYLIGGIGFNYAWDNQNVPALTEYLATIDSRNRMSHNYRVGTQLDVKVTPNLSVNLEVAANSISDHFNSKHSGCDDWQLTAQVGLAYRFGRAKGIKGSPSSDIFVNPSTIGTSTETAPTNTGVDIDKPQPAPEPKPQPAPEPKPEPKPQPAPTPVAKDITRNIFFGLCETTVSPAERPKITEVVNWLKEHPAVTVTVTGYADKGTGNATVNARYAKQRAETVTKELIRRGIPANRITTDSKGDTVQPFPYDNDMNRVTVIIGKE